MHVKSWDLDGEYFDGDVLAGPVPTLFSSDSMASLAAILAAPEKVQFPNTKNKNKRIKTITRITPHL